MSKKMGWITNAEKMREQLKQQKRKREEEEEGIRPPKRSRGAGGDGDAEQPTAVKIKVSTKVCVIHQRLALNASVELCVAARGVHEGF